MTVPSIETVYQTSGYGALLTVSPSRAGTCVKFSDSAPLPGRPATLQGVFQITRPNSTETADYGSYDTRTPRSTRRA